MMQAKQPDDKRPPLCRLKEETLSLLLPTVFAALFTLPVQLMGGLSVSGVTVLSNLLALPLAGYCVVFGMLAGGCGFIPGLEFAARSFSLVGGLLAKLLNAVAAFVRGCRWPACRCPGTIPSSCLPRRRAPCFALGDWGSGGLHG